MKINITSTTKIIHLNGVQARIWEGETDSGIKLHAYITRIAIDKDEQRTDEFDVELEQHLAPSPELEAIPLKMIL